MSLITLIVVLVVIGFVLWILTTYIPMPEPFRTIVIAVVAIIVVVWVVKLLFGDVAVPRL